MKQIQILAAKLNKKTCSCVMGGHIHKLPGYFYLCDIIRKRYFLRFVSKKGTVSPKVWLFTACGVLVSTILVGF